MFVCYGRSTNRFLLLHYGFCLEENRFNNFKFRLTRAPESDGETIHEPRDIIFSDYLNPDSIDTPVIEDGDI